VIDGLTLIGESINDSVPSTQRMYEANDIEGIIALAKLQDERGAHYIDVNVGGRDPEFMAGLVRKIQEVTTKPLSIDSPDPAICRAGLEAYDMERAGGAKPILNSISPLRIEMFDLLSICPFRPILLASENVVDGKAAACDTLEETVAAAEMLRDAAEKAGLDNDDLIFDLGIAPVGSDTNGNLVRLLGALEHMSKDTKFNGVHYSVGLSNFTVMLPPKRPDGLAVKSSLESAFLTKAMALGLDAVIGSVKRKYQLLPPEHPAMQCLDAVLDTHGFEVLMCVQTFYSGKDA
jgi:cobalamin-dependent methionine synthase I